MSDFDPDAYLAATDTKAKPQFDPDAYLIATEPKPTFNPDAYLSATEQKPAAPLTPPKPALTAAAQGVAPVAAGINMGTPAKPDPRTLRTPFGRIMQDRPAAQPDPNRLEDVFTKGLVGAGSALVGFARRHIMEPAGRFLNPATMLEDEEKYQDPASQALERGQESVDKTLAEIAPAKTFGEKVVQGAGGLAPIMATGLLGVPAAIISGGAIAGEEAHKDAFAKVKDHALKSGLTEEEATAKADQIASIAEAVNFGLGAITARFGGVGRALGRIGSSVEGGVAKAILGDAASQALFGEGQAVAGNALAKKLYDSDRELSQGAGVEDVLVNLVLGAGAGLTTLPHAVEGARANALEKARASPEAAKAIAATGDRDVFRQAIAMKQARADDAAMMELANAPTPEARAEVIQKLNEQRNAINNGTAVEMPPLDQTGAINEQSLEPTTTGTPPESISATPEARPLEEGQGQPPPEGDGAGLRPEADVAGTVEPPHPNQPIADDLARRIEEQRGVKTPLVAVEKPTGERGAEADATEALGTAIGKKVVWVKAGDEGVRFGGTVDDKNVYVNADSPNAFHGIMAHEATHRLEAEAPDLHAQLADAAKDVPEIKAAMDEIVSHYEKQGVAAPEGRQLFNEAIADAMQTAGSKREFWQKMYERAPEAVKKLVETIGKMIETVRNSGVPREVIGNLEKFHEVAASVMGEFIARKQAEIPEVGKPADETVQPLETTPAKEPKVGKNFAEQRVDEVRAEIRADIKTSGIDGSGPGWTHEDMGGIWKGHVRKGGIPADDLLQRMKNAGIPAEDPSDIGRLLRGENPTVDDVEARQQRALNDEARGEVERMLQQGHEPVAEDLKLDKSFKKYVGYAKTPENPAKFGGLDVYHSGKDWRAKVGDKWKIVKDAETIAALDKKFPGAKPEAKDAPNDLPFSLDKPRSEEELAKAIKDEALPERQFVRKVLDNPDVPERVKAAIAEKLKYEPESIGDTEKAALDEIKAVGMGEALRRVESGESKIGEAAQLWVAKFSADIMDEAARQLPDGSKEQEAHFREADRIIMGLAEKSSQKGRALRNLRDIHAQLFRAFDKVTGLKAHFQAAVEQLSKFKPDVDAATAAIKAEYESAKQALTDKFSKQLDKYQKWLQEAEARVGAQRRIADALSDIRENGYGSKKERAKILGDYFKKKPAAPDAMPLSIEDGVTPPEILKALIGDATEWLRDKENATAGDYLEFAQKEYGADANKTGVLDDVFRHASKLAKESFDNGLLKAKEPKTPKEPTPRDLLRRAARAEGKSLRQVVLDHYNGLDTGKGLVEKLMDNGMLKGDAIELGVKFQKEWNKIVDEEGKKILEAKFKKNEEIKGIGGLLNKALGDTVMDSILRDIRMGALDTESIKNALMEKYEIPKMTPQIEARLKRYADEVAALKKASADPENDVALYTKKQEVLRYIASQMKTGWGNVSESYINFSLLSGFITHAKNIESTALNVAAEVVPEAIAALRKAAFTANANELQKIPLILQSLATGLAGGTADAAFTVKTGFDPLHRSTGDKFEGSPRHVNIGEVPAKEFSGAKEAAVKAMNVLNINQRLLRAEDSVFNGMSRDVKAAILLADEAITQGKSGKDVYRYVTDKLGYGKVKELYAEADAQGLKGVDRLAHVTNKLNQGRGNQVSAESQRHAADWTFNNADPQGVLGAVHRGLQTFAGHYPVFRFLARYTRVAANVNNKRMEVSPIGLVSAATGLASPLSFGKSARLTPHQREVLFYKGMAGTLMTAGLIAKAMSSLEKWKNDPDKDKKVPDFDVAGSGAMNNTLQDQLADSGRLPYTISIDGGPYRSYMNTPLALPLAMVGAWNDIARFGKNEDFHDYFTRTVVALTEAGRAGLNDSFVANLNSFMRMTNERDPSQRQRRIYQFLGGFTNYAVPGAYRHIAQFFDPYKYKADDLADAMIQSVPVVRGLFMKPDLNLMGDPVKRFPTDTFGKDYTKDPELRWLNANNFSPSVPSRTKVYPADLSGEKKPIIASDPEYYDLVKDFGATFRENVKMIASINDKVPDQNDESDMGVLQRKIIKDQLGKAHELSLKMAEANLIMKRADK